MKSLIRKLLVGNTTITEYSKIRMPGEAKEKVYLQTGGLRIDVSQNHWLLCIEPVVFGVWLEKKERLIAQLKEGEYKIFFNSTTDAKRPVAILALSLLNYIEDENGVLLLLKLRTSTIYHLNLIRTFLLFKRYYNKNGLTFSKFKSFVSAYSFPRRIRLVSFCENEYYNVFPMDLLGDIESSGRYVFGLRHSNVTLEKIITTGKLVVSEVASEYKEIIYQLGKHHSSSPPPLRSLPFELVKTKNFGFYVPAWTESYKEIKILKTLNLGSHMLLWGEVENTQFLNPCRDHLFLIHFFQYMRLKQEHSDYSLA